MGTAIRATDLNTLTRCNRKVYLAYNGHPEWRVEESAYQAWILQEGREHEAQVVERMGEWETVTTEPGDIEGALAATLVLMRQGVGMVYQGVLMHDGVVGIPDILQRVEGGSRLGSYHYQPIDVKLGSTAQDGDRLQIMAYIWLLEAVQGVRPTGSLYLRAPPGERGDKHEICEEVVVFDGPVFEARLLEARALGGGLEPEPFIASVCHDCVWREHCTSIAERKRDVSLVPGLKRSVWQALHERGLGTLPAAAGARQEELVNIKGVGEKTARDIILRAKALWEGQSITIKVPPLPRPGPATFFDIESVPGEGMVYLMGTVLRDGDGDRYEYDLARSREEEPQIWESFLRRMGARGGTVFHYGAYEKTLLRKMAEKYGDEERVEAILARMVDLRRVLLESVVLPLRGYSLKDVAPWMGYEWVGDTQTAGDSMLEYMHWLSDGQGERLERILAYNESDCRALVRVYEWLRELAEARRV